MRRLVLKTLFCGWIVFAGVHSCHAQVPPDPPVLSVAPGRPGPEKGGHELQIWTGGGHGLNGITSHTGLWETGLRYGWVLTDAHGPGILRGKLEYTVDVVPILWVFQPEITYGLGVNPFALKWDFETSGRFIPYVELGGGTLFTSSQVPEGTSHVNFITGGAIGMHVLRQKLNWSAEVRFMHISNGSLFLANPGINTLQLRLGMGLFTQAHKN